MNDLSPWSPRQRRWLQALGLVVWRRGGGEEPVESVDADARPVAAPGRNPAAFPAGPAERAVDDAPRRAPAAPVPMDVPAATASSARPAMRRPARLPDRLQLAMLRASGLDPADPAALEVMAQWPVDRLRGDGAAKRAFWPQLRALRRRP